MGPMSRSKNVGGKVKEEEEAEFSFHGGDNINVVFRSKSKRKSNESHSIMHDVLKREKTESRRSFRNSRRKTNENLSILNDLARREKAESGRAFRDVFRRESMGTRKKLKERVVEKKVKKEADDVVSNAENDCPSKRHIPKVTTISAKYKCNHGVGSELADESFLTFMKFVKNGQQTVYAPEDDEEVVYMESDSDSEVVVLDLNPFSDANDASSKRHIPKVTTSSAKYKCNHGVGSELADESFLTFMKFVKNGQQMVYAPEDDEEVVYRESDSDSEVVVLDLNPFSDANDASFVAIGDEECRELITRRSQYEFRDKLVEFLRKPYDRKECNRRKLEAASLLDEYPDVAALIDQAQRNNLRILNLLRGFLYYLQNIAHEGIFKPWLDSECLSILPPIEDAV